MQSGLIYTNMELFFLSLVEKNTLSSMRLLILMFGITVSGMYIYYTIGKFYFKYKSNQVRRGKTPPTLPHLVPIFGSVLSYVRDPMGFMEQTV